MLSDLLINQIAEETKEKITSAEIVIDEKVESVQILRKEVVGNLLKVYTNITQGKGTITDIRLKDSKGNILISKAGTRVKTVGYALVSSFYIKFIEEELTNPINIFEMKEGLNG